MPMIEIHLNGMPRTLAADTTVIALLQELNLVGRRLAVEINQEIIPKSRHDAHRLRNGDRVEIVHAIGGG